MYDHDLYKINNTTNVMLQEQRAMEDSFIRNSEHLNITLKIIEYFNEYFLYDFLAFQTLKN